MPSPQQPQIEAAPLSGVINLDDAPQNVPRGTLRRWTRNVEWFGPRGDKRPNNLMGTINLFSAYGFSLPGGNNLCIGRKYDGVKYRMFWMNWNSNGNHGIYILNTQSQTIQTLIQNGIHTQGDVLGFLDTVTIPCIDIIYGDPVDGDILVYTDSQKRITRIPINLYLAGTYNVIKRNYLDLAKEPPPMPIHCVYENANGLQNNNLRNALFKFRCVHQYDIFDKSVFSTISECPLPYNAGDMTINQDPTKNGRIACYIPTGDVDVTRILVYAQQVKDGITSDWLLVSTLNKQDLGIPNNDLYRFLFYNDQYYPSADVALVVIDQTYVPQANDNSALFNGNVVAVGDTTEGYDQVAMPLMSVEQSTQGADLITYNGFLFFAYQNPDTGYVTIYLTGTGTNDVSDNPTTINSLQGAQLYVNAQDAAQAEVGFNVMATDTSINITLTQLQVASIAQGWTFISLGTNTLVIYRANTTLNSTRYFTDIPTISKFVDIFTSLPNCNYGYALLYRDGVGRSEQSALTVPLWAVKTPAQSSGANINELAQFQFIIAHRPPIWATNYQILRTPQLTYSKIENWITRQAYSQTVENIQYAYVDISNMDDYNTQINATEGVVSYDFAAGDRIRFTARWKLDGNSVDLVALGNYDYEILSVDINPNVNGVIKTGRFVKIYYPTADINVNFAFDGSDDFQNYQILLYNYAPHQATNVYYEFGKEWPIGNAGTTQAYHMANLQTQAANLSQSAIILINDGDCFLRYRQFPVGNLYYVPTGLRDQVTLYSTIDFQLPATVDTALYKMQATVGYGWDTPGDHPHYADTDYEVWNKSLTQSITVNVKGTIPVQDYQGTSGESFAFFACVITPGDVQTLTNIVAQQSALVLNNRYEYNYDFDITLPPNNKLWFITLAVNHTYVGGEQMTVNIKRTIQAPVIDTSFSDTYNIVTSSNGRPAVVDPNAKQQNFPVRYRFSQPDQQGTNINGISIMYPLDYDELDRSKGALRRIISRQRNARMFQQRGVCVVGIYARFIKNADGSTQLITSDTIVTQNNAQYYDGEFSIGDEAHGVFSDGYVDYYVDPVRGQIMRLSQDGNISLSEEAKLQTFVGPLATQYLTPHQGYYGGYAKILGCCNYKQDKRKDIIFVFQSGDNITGDTVIWDEAENAFSSFRDWQPDMLECGENVLYMWQKGVLYSLTNNNQRNTFFSPYGQIYVPGQVAQYGVIEQYGTITQYGIIYPSFLDVIFNPQASAKKEYRALDYGSQYGQIWIAPNAPDVSTELGQQSTLLEQDFDFREGVYSAAFWRDINSGGGQFEGDYLKGTWLEVILQRTDPEFCYLYGLYLNYVFSPRNG